MKSKELLGLITLLLFLFQSAKGQNELAAARKSGKWGFIDKQGKFVVEPKYDKVLSFSDGLAAVNIGYHFDPKNADACQTGKWGFIDAKGNMVVETKFEVAEPFREGVAKVNLGAVYRAYRGVTLMGGKWGFLRKDGSWFIEPNDTLYGEFSDGICSFKVPRGSKWGYINKENKTVIQPIYWNAGEFKQGLAPVMRDDYTFIYITATGKQAISSSYQKAYPFSEERGFVKDNTGMPQFINTGGTTVFKIENLKSSENINLQFSEGLVKIPVETGAGTQVGYAVANGAWVVKPAYELGDDFHGGMALVFSDRYYYFINHEGEKVFQVSDKVVEDPVTKIIHKGIPNPNIGRFSHGLCRVKVVDKWGYIDQKGNLKIEPQFEETLDFTSVN